jgi:hypothetical protein
MQLIQRRNHPIQKFIRRTDKDLLGMIEDGRLFV